MTISLHPDVAVPRCSQVESFQRVRIINARDAAVSITLGPFAVSIQPGQGALLDAPVGAYLAPGDHAVASFFEIFVQAP